MLEALEQLDLRIERRDYRVAGMATSGEAHLIWAMAHRPGVYRELARLDNVFFMENGWLTQRHGCYIDKQGPNGLSSIRGGLGDGVLTEGAATRVATFLGKLRRRVRLRPVRDQGDYLFLPLQVEKDTQLLYWSGCDARHPDRQKWFVKQVCRSFPDRKIVIRPHPRDLVTAERIERECKAVKGHADVTFRSDRGSFDWVAGAAGVIGINSTVLVEALALYKPVCAVGYGVFSGNGVALECAGDPKVLKAFPGWRPDRTRLTRFLHLLLERQIPYQLRSADVSTYPVLAQLVRAAHGEGNGQEPADGAPGSSGTTVRKKECHVPSRASGVSLSTARHVQL